MLDQFEWTGIYQVASFHPHYQFAGTAPDDPENLTNRAPYPLLHLLREDSIEAAVDNHPDVDGIPETNIRRMRALSAEHRAQLFAYLSRDCENMPMAKNPALEFEFDDPRKYQQIGRGTGR